MTNIRFAFYGTPERAVVALDELEKHNLVPSLIITQPDRPQGRSLALTPPPVKIWGLSRGIRVIQPEILDDVFKDELSRGAFDVAIVVAYGKILKEDVLAIPKKGSLNLHASLLPKLRGASPIETAILTDEHTTGATIILMDREVDHGPVLGSCETKVPTWPIVADQLATHIVRDGVRLLATLLPEYLAGKLIPQPQDHEKATYTQKIRKEDGRIDLRDDPWKNFLKWNAYYGWPGSYFFIDRGGKKIRVIIKEAVYENGQFIPRILLPEGKKEMSALQFEQWQKSPTA